MRKRAGSSLASLSLLYENIFCDNVPEKGGCRVLFTRHYYEKVYLKVLADWPLLLMVLLYEKEMKESCALSKPFLKEE